MCKHTITVLVTAFVLAAASFLPDPAQAQSGAAQPAVQDVALNPIGKVVAATGSVTIEHVNAVVVQAKLPSQAGETKVGDLVYQGDVVRTGADGRVSINFTDGTSFNLTNNANMTLNEFVYDPNGKSNSTLFNLSKGTFTFVAGKIAKTGDMKIDTPVATMGIRGTTPHVEISDDGTVKFSTLIEEGKSKVTKRAPGAATRTKSRSQAQFEDLSRVLGLSLVAQALLGTNGYPGHPTCQLQKSVTECSKDRRGLTWKLSAKGCIVRPRDAHPHLAIALDHRRWRRNRSLKNFNLRNLELCNGMDRTSLDSRSMVARRSSIRAKHTTAALAIAYNNRGNAYAAKGDYDRAVQDFDQSIKLNPTTPSPSTIAAWLT